MIVEARTTTAQLRAEATLQAQETVAAARAQATAIVSEAYEQADEASVAARGMRAAAETELAEARKEAEAVRQRAWDGSSKLRKEIDTHAQELLARTHREVEMSLRASPRAGPRSAAADVTHFMWRGASWSPGVRM